MCWVSLYSLFSLIVAPSVHICQFSVVVVVVRIDYLSHSQCVCVFSFLLHHLIVFQSQSVLSRSSVPLLFAGNDVYQTEMMKYGSKNTSIIFRGSMVLFQDAVGIHCGLYTAMLRVVSFCALAAGNDESNTCENKCN